MKNNLLTIGELARRTGCSIKALRYYDSIGLLPPTYIDPDSHYRYYTVEQTRMVELIQICINLSIPLKEVKELIPTKDQTLNYKQLIEYGKQMTEEKIAALQENLIVLNDLQHEIERINSYRDDESKVFTFNETYYYTLPLEEEEMNDHFYKRLETMFNECFHQNLSIKPDYSVIIQQNNEHVKKFVACEIYQHDSPLPNLIKVNKGLFICKKTDCLQFKAICKLFSEIEADTKTIIISPGYNYSLSSPYFEVKCTL